MLWLSCRLYRCGKLDHDGHADLELDELTIKISGRESLAQQFDAVYLGFCAAPALITTLSSPDGSADALRDAQGLEARSHATAFHCRPPKFWVL